jgi:hypothetical protein
MRCLPLRVNPSRRDTARVRVSARNHDLSGEGFWFAFTRSCDAQHESIAWNIEGGRTITFIMCQRGRRDTIFQVARCLTDPDIMRRYRMADRTPVRSAPTAAKRYYPCAKLNQN